jgi:hypothetical protein
MLSKKILIEVRYNALRKRIWYKVIDGIERGIINLTISIVDNVKSHTLEKEIIKILNKLKEASKNIFSTHYEIFGLNKVKELVEIAMSFGNTSALKWINDETYAKLVTVNDINNPVGWN